MKRWIFLLAFACVAFFATGADTPPSAGPYYGSSKSDVYHRATCKYVGKIAPDHLVKFETKDEAQQKGYRPCKVCKP